MRVLTRAAVLKLQCWIRGVYGRRRAHAVKLVALGATLAPIQAQARGLLCVVAHARSLLLLWRRPVEKNILF
jgi:hypothetical protein